MSLFVLFSVLFAADSVLHLYLQARRPDDGIDHIPLAVTKCLIVPLLSACLLCLAVQTDLSFRLPALLSAAAFLYFCGDLFLTLRFSCAFYIGAGAFLAGHIALSVWFLAGGFSLPLLLASALVLSLLLVRFVLKLKRAKAEPLLPYAFYSLILFAFIACSAASTNVLAAAGSALFAYSDCAIVSNVTGMRKRSDAVIMLSYILALVLLASGAAAAAGTESGGLCQGHPGLPADGQRH